MKPISIISPLVPAMRARISHAKVFNGIVYVSGMVGRDMATGKLIEGGVGIETRQTLINLGHVLKEAGTDFDHVITTNCYISDMKHFAAFNEEWEKVFPVDPPTRICVQVVLGLTFNIEIDAVAALPN
jgi:2-iminobutanoate/2-iminopropanoate deaminase